VSGRWYFVSTPRWSGDTEWLTSGEVIELGSGYVEALQEELLRSAQDNFLTLHSLTPEPGWLYKIPGSGREIPCGEKSVGCRPVWIWRAQ
jgi:hypothetical protein